MSTTSLRAFLYWQRMTRKLMQNLGRAVSREARSAYAQARDRNGVYLVHEALARVTARFGAAGLLWAKILRQGCAHISTRSALGGSGLLRCRRLAATFEPRLIAKRKP